MKKYLLASIVLALFAFSLPAKAAFVSLSPLDVSESYSFTGNTIKSEVPVKVGSVDVIVRRNASITFKSITFKVLGWSNLKSISLYPVTNSIMPVFTVDLTTARIVDNKIEIPVGMILGAGTTNNFNIKVVAKKQYSQASNSFVIYRDSSVYKLSSGALANVDSESSPASNSAFSIDLVPAAPEPLPEKFSFGAWSLAQREFRSNSDEVLATIPIASNFGNLKLDKINISIPSDCGRIIGASFKGSNYLASETSEGVIVFNGAELKRGEVAELKFSLATPVVTSGLYRPCVINSISAIGRDVNGLSVRGEGKQEERPYFKVLAVSQTEAQNLLEGDLPIPEGGVDYSLQMSEVAGNALPISIRPNTIKKILNFNLMADADCVLKNLKFTLNCPNYARNANGMYLYSGKRYLKGVRANTADASGQRIVDMSNINLALSSGVKTPISLAVWSKGNNYVTTSNCYFSLSEDSLRAVDSRGNIYSGGQNTTSAFIFIK